MRSLRAGILAGVLAGIVMGIGMQVMTAPTPDGGHVPMMAMVGDIPLRYDPTGALDQLGKVTVGWIYHLINSAIIGALFVLVFGGAVRNQRSGIGWGLLYGVVWWVLGGLTLMPLLLGMPAFAPLMMPPMRPVAFGSLIGHLMYGLILGVAYVWLARAVLRENALSARSVTPG